MEEEKQKKLPTFSFSKLKNFGECPICYYKNYVLHEKKNDKSGLSEFGTFCHKILEMYEKGQLEIWEMLSYYQDNFQTEVPSSFVVKMSDTFSKDLYPYYYADGENYFTNFEGYSNWEILESEYEFEIPITDYALFNGKVDLIARSKKSGRLIIIDHKSKSKFKSKEELADYAKQLYLYAYAVHEKYGEWPKTLYFNMFRKGELVVIPFDKKEYRMAMDWAKRTIDAILSVNWDSFKVEETNNFCVELEDPIVKIENPCYNTDTKKLRFGDGHKKYSELLDYKNDFYGRNLCGYKDSCGLCVNYQ